MFSGFRLVPPAALWLCLGAGACWAAEESNDIPEITVTAQKVKENLRDVPISISVVGAAQLNEQHLSNTEDLTRVVPNFSFSSNGNPGSNALEVRGISSSAGASTVGIYLDDVSITARTRGTYNVGQPEPYLLDVDQIEVLRGPQGTLYGASSEGGVIKFRTNPVNLTDFGGTASASLSGTQHGGPNYNVSAVINAPLVDGIMGLRLGAATSYDDGYIDRYSPDTGGKVGSNVNDHRTSVARVAFEARPVEGLAINPNLFYERISYGSSDTVSLGLGNYSVDDRVSDGGSDTMIVPSLSVTYDMGGATLTSITSDYTRDAKYIYDGTAFNSVYIGACFLDGQCGSPPVPDLHGRLSGSQIEALPAPAHDVFFERQVAEELRLASPAYKGSGLPLTWVAGIYLVDSRSRADDVEYINNFNQTFTSLYGPQVLTSIFGGPLPNQVIYQRTNRFEEKQYSLFGDLSYYATRALRFSIGARYLTAYQSFERTGDGFFNGGPTSDAASAHDHATTPRVSVTYEITDQTSVYATASEGFRLGAPNPLVPTQFCAGDLANLGLAAAPHAYSHENLWNYEFGVKSQPARWATINASAFYIKWDKLQQSFNLPICGFSFSTNVGSARSYGGDLELTVRPTSELTLSATSGYTNATLTEPVTSLGIERGTPVEGAPRWNASAAGEFKRPLTPDLSGFLRANYNYTGSSHGALLVSDPDYNRPSYDLVGASFGVTHRDWEFGVYATNLFNEQKIIQTPDHASLPVGYTLRPRTIGVSASGKF